MAAASSMAGRARPEFSASVPLKAAFEYLDFRIRHRGAGGVQAHAAGAFLGQLTASASSPSLDCRDTRVTLSVSHHTAVNSVALCSAGNLAVHVPLC